MNIHSSDGSILLGTIFLVLLISVFSAQGVSMIAGESRVAVNAIHTAQANALAVAASHYALEQLQGDLDWSDQTDITNIQLGDGEFDISYTRLSEDSVDLSIQARIGQGEAQSVKNHTLSIERSPKAAKFAVYRAGSTVRLRFRSGSVVNGNVYNRGNVLLQGGSTQPGGTTYVPDTATGTAVKLIANAPAAIPVLDTGYYDNLITTYETIIDTAIANGPSSDTLNNETITLTGNTLEYNDLTTRNGNNTIQGDGIIVATGDIDFQTRDGATTIIPTTGDIVILAAGRIQKNATSLNRVLNVISSPNGKVIFYARCTASNDRLRFRGDSSNIDSALLMSARRLDIWDSANVTGDSVLYVIRGDPAGGENNYMHIRDTGTLAEGTLISVSDRDPALRISRNDPTVSGFVYSRGAVDQTGTLDINNATLNGAIMFNSAFNTRINNARITYDKSVITPEILDRFDGSVSVVEDSWDGN